MFGSFDISASALTAQRIRLDTISSNVANIHTTHDAQGHPNPYRRLFTVFAPQQTSDGGAGVHVAAIQQDMTDFRKAYEPGNPDHDASGNVYYPNVDLSTEMVDALEATRAYEANITAVETTKSMIASSLRILA
jgi:flagellar basal-body rod protein FlgC